MVLSLGASRGFLENPNLSWYLPVISPALLGPQTANDTYPFVNTTPLFAILSIPGVGISVLPLNPTSPYPWSSVSMMMIFGAFFWLRTSKLNNKNRMSDDKLSQYFPAFL
jgi:hypothetical protein